MAGFLQYLGDASLKFEAIEVLYGPKGNTTRYKVTSPSVAALTSYYNFIIRFGASGTLLGADYGEIRELQVELPGLLSSMSGVINELFFDQWELLTNEASDTIFANPRIIGGSSPLLSGNDKDVLSYSSLKAITPSEAVAEINSSPLAPSPIYTEPNTTTGVAKQIYKEVLRGQVEYGKPTYVLRHTSYCSPQSTYNASVDGAMTIYTTAQLLSEVGSGWTYNLPPRLYSKISSIPTQVAPTDEADYYQWGWLKKITREPVMANFIVEASCEYELALWSNLRYAPH